MKADPKKANVEMLVREVRKSKGLTIVELSKISGISKSHISEIETNEQMPTLPMLCLLAEALEVKPEKLYTYT